MSSNLIRHDKEDDDSDDDKKNRDDMNQGVDILHQIGFVLAHLLHFLLKLIRIGVISDLVDFHLTSTRDDEGTREERISFSLFDMITFSRQQRFIRKAFSLQENTIGRNLFSFIEKQDIIDDNLFREYFHFFSIAKNRIFCILNNTKFF